MSNIFQRLATQIAKDDSKKKFNIERESFNLRRVKSIALAGFKENKRTYEDAKKYKNWNKDIEA